MTLRTLTDLRVAMDTTAQAIKDLRGEKPWSVPQRRIIKQFADAQAAQNKIIEDRHNALLEALQFALAMRRDPHTNAWVDTLGNVFEPSADVDFLLAEAEIELACGPPPHRRSRDA